MSMIHNYARIPSDALQEIIKDTNKIFPVFFPKNWEEVLIQVERTRKQSLRYKILSSFKEDKETNTKIDSIKQFERKLEGRIFHMDVYKAWHGIHFLLTGLVWGTGETALGNVIMGGESIGPDLGYGPARYLTPDEVKQCSEALKDISIEELRSRFNQNVENIEAADLYPFSDRVTQEDLDFILDNFAPLKQIYEDTANAGDSMILYMM